MKEKPKTPVEVSAAERMRRRGLVPFVKGHQTHHRPIGSRNRLQGSFLYALAQDFEKFGKGSIEAARMIDPMGYIKCIASLMPKQFEQTTVLEELTDAELSAGIAFLRSRLTRGTGEGDHPPCEPSSLN